MRVRGCTFLRSATVAAATAGTLLFLVPAQAAESQALETQAAPTDKELAELEKKAKKLAKEYRGEILSLKEARKSAKDATKRVGELNKELAAARSAISQLAVNTYVDPALYVTLVAGDSPDEVLRNAARTSELAVQKNTRVQEIDSLAAEAAAAKKSADQKVRKFGDSVKDAESQRDKVLKLLKKHKEEKAKKDAENGMRRGKGKSPLVGNTMTARMRTAYLEIDNKFGAFPSIGCYRAGDPQDHGSGRACDFMESTGGRMPGSAALKHGDAVAQYAINNSSRLGIKYVIWKQRIWDVRTSGGWRQMGDRGSITANHWDHVHISVL